MKKKSISLIIGLMSFALLGVMAMQYYFIRESYGLKSQLFDQSVSEALNAVGKKLEKRDANRFLNQREQSRPQVIKDRVQREILSPQESRRQLAQMLKTRKERIAADFKMRDSLLRIQYPTVLVISNDFYETYLKDPDDFNKVHLQVKQQQITDIYGQSSINEQRYLYVDKKDEKQLVKAKNDSVHYLIEDPEIGLRIIALPRINAKLKHDLAEQERQIKKFSSLIDSVKTVKKNASMFEDLAHEYQMDTIPLRKRLDIRFIDATLRSELYNRGINLPYGYKVSMTNPDSIIFTRIVNKQTDFTPENSYRTTLFPKELREAGFLIVSFPTRNTLLLQNMKAVLLSSGALLFILATCFGYTISIILRQKKISEMKTDFINNMTHEFKTPVATIMIASEALKDPEVIEEQSRVKRLAGIIYDENVRLGNHIERVLNIAKIDKDDLKLENKPVNMNELIAAVVDSMQLQLQKKEAKISVLLNAVNSIIWGDELHLSNVIFNLIDNANKYSRGTPDITITTLNHGKNLVIKIADKGIGMNRDQLSRIFDQFYRIPTGNLHDVKGFGLGLSYVNNIVKYLNGNIKVKSEKDKGSEFEISLPVSADNL